MAKRERPKSKPPFASRGAVIRMQRVASGLTAARLAKKADISEKTLGRAERGETVSDNSLAAIAKALNLDFELLKYDPRNHPLPRRDDPEVAVDVATRIPLAHFSTDEARQKFVESLASIIKALSVVHELCVRQGSTIVTVQMTYGDIHRLAVAFLAEELDPLEVHAVTVTQLETTLARLKALRRMHLILHRVATTLPRSADAEQLLPHVAFLKKTRKSLAPFRSYPEAQHTLEGIDYLLDMLHKHSPQLKRGIE